jgi:hypothetical protein
MKLSEVFSQLSYGELSQLSLGSSGAGVIDASNHAQMVAHVNLGLMALYKRFPLKESRLTFALQAGRTTYPMTTVEDVVFMEGDSEFTDDILKIERVYTSRGYELGLNDLEDVYSCHTPSATILRVPAEIAAQSLSLVDHLKTDSLVVVYRAMHPIIEVKGSSFSPARVELELPYSHLEPLLLFVASRVNNPIGMTNEFHAGNSYAAKYEQACQQLEIQNLRVDQGSQGNRLQIKGWV